MEQTAEVMLRCIFNCLDDLEDIAAKKWIRLLLDEKWRKVYKANAPRGMFSPSEMHHAA